MANFRSVSEVHADFCRRTAEYLDAVYPGSRRTPVGTFTIQADDVARTIERAVRSSHPRARYLVGFLAHNALALRRPAPDAVFDDLFVWRVFPVPHTMCDLRRRRGNPRLSPARCGTGR
ncbi:hypothetical protein ACFY9A_38615 [Streptomyces rubradiris]|uniref:hypothetical protein n=1 Tax=Streptomyces rubradiris TaxID=285531 RepID=UPI0036ED4C8B